jgi:hypothetical protein
MRQTELGRECQVAPQTAARQPRMNLGESLGLELVEARIRIGGDGAFIGYR